MKINLLFIMFFFFYLNVFGQNKNKKQISALRISEKIIIDGDLSELSWNKTNSAKNFKTNSPTMNENANQKTEVKILYDDNAIYFAAILYDTEPDKILKELSKRDSYNNTDLFTITLNTYNDGQNIFNFKVTASNVQLDIKNSANSNDVNWNVVWESEVKITNFAWIVEIKIPYSAIRFPAKKEQTWGVNFWRTIRRIREVSSWNFVDRAFSSGSQAGEIINLKNIKAPFRLELFPYLSANYLKKNKSDAFSYSGGLDLKYGISESFTLDMTLIPDFGQTASDNKILNLTPYETHYSENRQFFTEGTELFNKLGLFYSRRIGEKSSYIENNYHQNEIVKNPKETKLLNSTKISGRTKNNLGIGIFNATTENSYSTLKDTLTGIERDTLAEPLTNYNVIVLDKSFGKNSYLNFTNTNVFKHETENIKNVFGTGFKFLDKKNIYGINGKIAFSSENDTVKSTENKSGFFTNLNIGKHYGNLYYNYNFEIIDDNYTHNAMGFLFKNNQIYNSFYIKYNIFEPTKYFLNYSIDFNFRNESLYKPRRFTKTAISISSNIKFHNHLTLNFNINTEPQEMRDYFEAREDGVVFKKPARHWISSWFSSDYRKIFALDGYWGILNSNFKNSFWFGLTPICRVNDKFSFRHSFAFDNDKGERGYVTNDDNIIFGKRDIKAIINTFNTTFVFNNKSFLSIKLRYYWKEVIHEKFYILNKNGYLDDYLHSENEDMNVNIYNFDLSYSWNFAAGSFITLVWKQEIFNDINDKNKDIIYNFKNTILDESQSNFLSIKISYYLNYNSIKKLKF